MDIGDSAFPHEILKILQEVSESHFIAFDLEFSGVASWRPTGAGKSTKLSLQEYYQDIKAAAEKYQILQVGLTVVKEDLNRGRYVARPYNFNISPLTSLRERHFGREWSYHSGAIAFLTRNGFKFDRPIVSGVQYLARNEEQIARQNIINEEDSRSKLADMDLKPEDDILIQHIRSSVRKWQSQAKEEQDAYLNIPAEEPGLPQQLSRYQVRMTHQIVRNEYPNLKTTGMGHFVQVTNPTEEQQASQKLVQIETREKDIAKAIGFRWLIEGIVGGNILGMPEEYITSGLRTLRLDGKSDTDFLQSLQHRLKARPRVLVGHNCFTDFVNLYKCFIGPLPDTVERFASEIHDLFPGVLDTKSLASFGHKRWGNTSLEDVDLDLRGEEKPKIVVPAEYERYAHVSKYHEAGYDSLLTAKIAIKLSAKLEREHEYLEKLGQREEVGEVADFGAEQDDFHETITEPVNTELNDGAAGITPSRCSNDTANRTDEGDGDVVAVRTSTHSSQKPEGDEVQKAMQAANRSELLQTVKNGPKFGWSDDWTNSDSAAGNEGQSQEQLDLAKMQKTGEIMPVWDNKTFWTLFGNKLQVNGSKEGVCKLE